MTMHGPLGRDGRFIKRTYIAAFIRDRETKGDQMYLTNGRTYWPIGAPDNAKTTRRDLR